MTRSKKPEIYVHELAPPVPARHLKSLGGLALSPVERDDLTKNIDKIVGSKHQHLIVAKAAGRIVGMTIITELEDLDRIVAYRGDIRTKEGFEKRETAERLLRHFAVDFADENRFALQIATDEPQSSSRIYNQGFQETGLRLMTHQPRPQRAVNE